jgi:hypothetical protein
VTPRAHLCALARAASSDIRLAQLETSLLACARRSRRQLETSIALEPCVGAKERDRKAATIGGVRKQNVSRTGRLAA